MTSNTTHHRLPRSAAALLSALFVLAGAVLPGAQAHAQDPAPAPPAADALQQADVAGGVQITWRSPGAGAAAAGEAAFAAAAAVLPTVRHQGYDLPLQAVPVRVAGPEALAGLQIRRLNAVPLPDGAVVPGAPDLPPVLNDDGALRLAPQPEPALPTAPVFVLRSGRVDGQFVAVLAVSPLYAENGALRLATELEAFLPGAARVADFSGSAGEAGGASTAAPGDALAALAAASAARFKIEVAAPGVQRVPLAALPGYSAADLADARLTLHGQPVPVQVSATELRFYAPAAGDRWNTTTAYFLGVDAANKSPAMRTRALAPLAAAGAPSVALERGAWTSHHVYESLSAGIDGDHWFAANLSSRPGAFVMNAGNTITATLWNDAGLSPPSVLPLAAGPSTFTVRLSPYRSQANDSQPLYSFRVKTDGGAVFDFPNVNVSYNAGGRVRWYTNYDHLFTVPATVRTMTFSVLPVADFAGANVNSIVFERPVTLDLGQKGAAFAGSAGQTKYAWKNANPGGGLYDVTDPALPIVLTGANANGFTDPQAARSYLLAGENTLHTPAVTALSLASFDNKGADAIYVVPDGSYTSRLEPLVALRQQQGYKVEVVGVRAIYDAFSYGQVAPEGIRRFLQYAYAGWSPRPISVVLVGDGTWDVKNYTRKAMSPALIPPYMHDGVDPWLGEAPCDNCYGQLDGANPHTGDDANGRVFAMELWVGRLPVKSPDELGVLVDKIAGYETATAATAASVDSAASAAAVTDAAGSSAAARSVLFYADNFRKPNPNVAACQPGDGYTEDKAGNFAAVSDSIFSAVVPAARTQRVYYDPFPADNPPEPWSESNTNRLGERLFAALNAGPDVAVYNGHASTWHMGATERDVACEEPGTGGLKYRPALLNLYDEMHLNNATRLFVQLSMTCLTSQFAIPADAGTTIDERLLLHPDGGAVAVWGPAGLSVVHGHDMLQKGFFAQLLAAPGGAPRLGDLVDAGYRRVLAGAYGTEDVLRTFLLLGDPLTRLRFNSAHNAFLPVVNR